jgi:hypothetical protein
MNSNGNSLDGWIESIDPKSGRTFYANRFTRTTQWEAPAGWKTKTTTNNNDNNHNNGAADNKQEEEPLPDGWEEMTDPKSGRSFYIDHARQITTWERPGRGGNQQTTTAAERRDQSSQQQNNANGGYEYNINNTSAAASIMKLNQFGSHSHWDDDPHTGSRFNHQDYSTTTNNNHHHTLSLMMQQETNTTTTTAPPPPRLDFTVLTIPDSLRPNCPSCSNPFSYYTVGRRRHHCRLCGDIFCDACSSHRTVLPLEGEEFDKPVRVCDVCMRDVRRGNYFSLRRYLTSLQLYNDDDDGGGGKKKNSSINKDEKKREDGSISSSNNGEQQITLDMVAASLSSLSTDIDAMLLEPLTSFTDKMTIPANILVPAVSRHLKRRKTGEYAIRVLATLLQLGNVVGDDSFGLAVLGHSVVVNDHNGVDDNNDDEEEKLIKSDSTNSIRSLSDRKKSAVNNDNTSTKNCNYVKDILKILEWNGNDIRTLSAQEQAVKVIYYITDPNFIAGALSMKESLEEDENNVSGDGGSGPVDVDAVGNEYNDRKDEMIQIDIHRAFRSMLDHATSSASPSLQRWATACLRHLITEDQRRACSVAYSSPSSSKYESFTSQLVSTGGVMILCSLLNSDDGETRAHATSALEAIVIATREIGLALHQSPGKGRGLSRVGRGTERDSAIVDAIISNVGGSGLPALAHLLISADESVSMMGCSFILSLISPLLTDPRGSGRTLQQCSNTATSTGLGFEEKDDGLSSYRNAAIALVVGDDTVQGSDVSCLPSLIEIVRSGVEYTSWEGGNKARPLKVQAKAAECIAAIALAVGHVIGMATTDQSSYDPTYVRAKSALEVMEQERVFDVALQIIASDSHRSLDSSRDTPDARLREAAGLILLALSSCSSISSSYLMSNGAVSTLLSIASESGMLSAASTVRGKWASKGLCFLEAATTLLIQAWTTSTEQENDASSSSSSSLNLLLEVLNSGAVGMASRLVKTKVSLKSHDLAYSQLRVKIAICFMLSSMFGIANNSHANNDVGASRLYSAVDADCAQFLASGGDDTGVRTDLVGATLNLLNATLPYAHQFTKEDADEPLPMVDLSEACLLAAGSICGLADPIGVHSSAQSNDDVDAGKYSHLRLDACTMACNILTAKKPGQAALLPTALVGAIGESLIAPSLRLSLAICRYGNIDLCGELAGSGMLVPVGDILQRALASSDRYTFSVAVAVVRFCGQCTVVGSSASGTMETLKSAIHTLSCVLALPANENGSSLDPQRLKELSMLKYESLVALEALCANEALQNSIASVLPALVSFLQHLEYSYSCTDEIDQEQIVLIALKTIQRLINIPKSAQSIMNNGVVSILINIVGRGDEVKNKLLQELSLEIVHSIAQSNLESRYWLICSGLLKSLLSMLGESQVTARTAQLGLQNAGILLSDLKPSTLSRFDPSAKEELLQQVVTILCTQRTFVRRLIATIVDDCEVYGESFVFPQDDGVGVRNIAAEILFHISSLLLIHGQKIGSAHFYDALMLNDVSGSDMSVATACSALLEAFSDDEDTSSRAPANANPDDRSFYFDVQLPTVKSHLMEGLTKSLNQAMSSSGSKDAAKGLIKRLNLSRTCLLLCRSEKLAESSFRLFEDVVLPLPIDFVGDLILCDRVALVTLFDLVTGQANKVPDLEYSKQTFAKLLGNLAKAGLLPKAVKNFGVRSHAIAALSAAMLINGSEENIDDDEDSIQRICLESLAIILCGQENELKLTPVESRALASAVGKVLSSTILNRFFTQASLESTINDVTVDFQLNRAAICQSAEARLLCAMAHYPESLGILSKIGGLEAIGLIAHEGEIKAVEAVRKACDMNPQLVVDVEAHLSIMDALIGAEDKLSNTTDVNLRDVVVKCLEIVTFLSVTPDTRDSILKVEQSHGCMIIASSIVSASAELKLDSKSVPKVSEEIADVTTTRLAGKLASVSIDVELQIDDLVLVDSTSSKSGSTPKKLDDHSQELEGVVAYVGSVQFAPGDDWIGIRLTGSSVGKGRNDGSVKGTHYFDCKESSGVFVKRAHVRKREFESTSKDDSVEKPVVPVSPKRPGENHWSVLVTSDDASLEEASFALLQSFLRSKQHRDEIINNNEFKSALAAAIRSSTNMDFKRDALELLSSFTVHYCEPDQDLMQLFCDVIETQTRSLQLSRDKQEQASSKHLLGMVVLGLQNLCCCFQNAGDQTKPLRVVSDLFIFLSDTLFSGPKSRRTTVSKTDGVLFSNLTSLFLLFLGNEDTRKAISTARHLSSLVRFVMMTSGVETMDCHIAFSNKEGEEYWEAAHTHCLQILTFIVNEATHVLLNTSFASLIEECQPPSNSFRMCVQHISDRANGGASTVSARLLLTKLERLS